MKCYFHCDPNMYIKRVRTFLEYTAAPVVFIATFLTVCLLLSLRNLMNSGLLFPAAAIICAVIFVFALIIRIMLEIAEHSIKVHSKYTYVEIGLKDVIVSEYAGSFTHFGEKTTLRRLFVIPLTDFDSAEINKSGKVLIKGKIRCYSGNTNRLGYYFKEGGLVFKEFFYQVSGFKELTELLVPRRFANPERIAASIRAAKERFDSLPSPKPYVFEEDLYAKARKMREKARRSRDY